ncbi:MAG: hypothetical protein JW759_10690 [Candidatus Coatesbacteria bacterium]|nr:hypothetical protein [Candidatus Coatesbacteria bacterium]
MANLTDMDRGTGSVTRIQGTDGIRRPTALDDDPRVQAMTPLDAFLKAGLITPRFMELYAYSFITDLVRLGRLRMGDPVVVGWDPRDPERQFINAFISGIRKAGAAVLSVGVVPTPAVPAYLLHVGASGGAMITASHNLKDQNGVKLFWANHGLKYLPADDERLTAVIFEMAETIDLDQIGLVGQLEDHHDRAAKMFVAFMLEPANSWLDATDDPSVRPGLNSIDLVVDTANGCLSRFAGDLFRRWGIDNVYEVNNSLAGDVNENGGVAALEGTETIERSAVFSDGGVGGSPFSEHAAVLKLFELADERKEQLLAGDRLLMAAVFDADGDRFFRLDYSPRQDALIVSSGDEAAFLQAQFLVQHHPVSDKPRIAHTVESDINVGNFAAKSLDVSPVMTAVGDKWVLFEAFASFNEARIRLLQDQLAWSGQGALLRDLEGAVKALESLRWQRSNRSQSYFDLQAQIDKFQAKNCSPIEREELERQLLRTETLPFLMGFEETGHSITPAVIAVRGQGGRITNRLYFAGNGLKAGINTLVATETMRRSMNLRSFHQMMAAPFPRGFKRTYYAFYTRKESFAYGKPYWQDLAAWLEQECDARFSAGFEVERVEFAEERDMVFIALSPKGSSGICASVFVRNSGTEEKTGVNVRGPKDIAGLLDQVGDLARRRLQSSLKSNKSEYAKAEMMLLAAAREAELAYVAFTLSEAADTVASKFPTVIVGRLLLEMFKQDFITLTSLSDPRALIRLTDLARWYVA